MVNSGGALKRERGIWRRQSRERGGFGEGNVVRLGFGKGHLRS